MKTHGFVFRTGFIAFQNRLQIAAHGLAFGGCAVEHTVHIQTICFLEHIARMADQFIAQLLGAHHFGAVCHAFQRHLRCQMINFIAVAVNDPLLHQAFARKIYRLILHTADGFTVHADAYHIPVVSLCGHRHQQKSKRRRRQSIAEQHPQMLQQRRARL